MTQSFFQKNSRAVFLLVIVLSFIISYFFLSLYKSQPVKINKSPPTPSPKVMPNNLHYGVNVEMSQILPTSTKYVVNSKGEDLIDVSSKLGINMFRITNSTRSFDNSKEAIYSKDQWFEVLDKMQQKNIKALILVETPSGNSAIYNQNIQPVYLEFLKKYLLDSGILSHPNIYAVDIKNEPIITDHNIYMLRQASAMIKKASPKTAVTVGWWGVDTHRKDQNNKPIYAWDDYEAGKYLEDFIDFYSIHMYGFDKKELGITVDPNLKTKLFLGKVKQALNTKRPLLITEFGAANGEAVSDQDTIGDPNLQANVYNGVYKALQDLSDPQIKCTIAFQLLSRNSNNDAWALAKNKGDFLFPAAYVLQKYATGQSNQNLKLPLPVSGNEHLILNSDKDATVSAKLGDKIGLKLTLDPKFEYSLKFTNQNLLKEIDKFHLNPNRSIYQALYQTQTPGETILIVTKSTKSQIPVFKVKINIQK
jgi:hypothetical protein